MPNTLQRRVAELQVRSVDREQRTIDFIASTFALDSHGTRIDPNGWTFARNVPITWAHDDLGYTPSGGRPIGRAVNLRVENGELRGRAEFPRRGIFQFADECFDLAADGFITSTSVGFDPIKEETTDEEGQRVPIYRKQKCLEIAFVTIPSNEDAVLMRAKALNREEDVKTIQERIKNIQDMAAELSFPPDEPAQDASIDYKAYYERKQPANKESTKVLEHFFRNILKQEPPADEAAAWKRMAEAVEGMQEAETAPEAAKEEPQAEAQPAETPAETAEATPEETITPPSAPADQEPESPPAPADQEPARQIQIPLSVLLEFPSRLTQSYVDAAAAALRQGIPLKEAVGMIDGMNGVVCNSLSHISHGKHS